MTSIWRLDYDTRNSPNVHKLLLLLTLFHRSVSVSDAYATGRHAQICSGLGLLLVCQYDCSISTAEFNPLGPPAFGGFESGYFDVFSLPDVNSLCFNHFCPLEHQGANI